jgi:hypothetical protein
MEAKSAQTTNSRRHDGVDHVEWCDTKAATQRFGLRKPHLYILLAEGKIRASCIRRPGALRGRRLWLVESIRAFIEANES